MLSRTVQPGFLGSEHPLLKNGARIPNRVGVCEPLATLENEDFRSRSSQSRSERSTPHSRSYDGDVNSLLAWHNVLYGRKIASARSDAPRGRRIE